MFELQFRFALRSVPVAQDVHAAFLGLGAVVRDGVTVAERCLVGAGAVVTRDTEPNGVYTGVPAKRGPRLADELDNV